RVLIWIEIAGLRPPLLEHLSTETSGERRRLLGEKPVSLRANLSTATVGVDELEQARLVTHRREHVIDPIKLELLQYVLLVIIDVLAVAHHLRLVELVKNRSL